MRDRQTLIIAEAGVNHNGDLGLARELIDAAAEAKADLVKFQTFSADRLTTRHAEKADYQRKNNIETKSQRSMLAALELSQADHVELMNHCDRRGIKFFSTGFDIEDVRFLTGLGVDLVKIPSGELTNLPFLRYVGSLGLQIIMSTGMASLGEIESSLGVLLASGGQRKDITVLQCTTSYPTEMADVNLLAMKNISDALGVSPGFSDHTEGIEAAIAAVALGASVIEKHFTLDKTMGGPDHAASLDPNELSAMVRAIRNVEVALGDGIKTPSESERRNIKAARRSIVASRDIAIGEIFSESNLTVKRPGHGLSPMQWDDVIGTTAMRSYDEDEAL